MMVMVMMVMTKTMCGVGENSVDAAAGGGDDDSSHARLFLSVVASAYVYQRHHILLMLLDQKNTCQIIGQRRAHFFQEY